MDDRAKTDPVPQRFSRSRFLRATLAAVGLSLAAWAALWGWIVLTWGRQGVNAAIPLERARIELAERLQRFVNVTLDPAARIVAAHELRDGFRGGGDSWYLAELDPTAAARFEADFHNTVRPQSGTGHIVPFTENLRNLRALQGLGLGLVPPAGARAWWLDDHRATCAVFFDDKFYFYLDNF